MPKNLVIVESPAKAKTISKYLGKDFEVMASYGHVRDLVPKEGAVDPNNKFAMKYQIIERSEKHVNAIVRALKKASALYLATDPDRGEGKKVVPVQYSGPSVKAGYNYKYMLDVLGALDSTEVSLEIIDTLSPTLVRDVDSSEALFVVMPMRL